MANNVLTDRRLVNRGRAVRRPPLSLSKAFSLPFTPITPQAPITRLSDDLLQTIFDLLSTAVPRGPARVEAYSDTHPYGPLAPQIALSHVCRRWRWVALGMATLWNRLILERPEQIPFIERLIRERTKTALLEIAVLDLHPFFDPRPGAYDRCTSASNRRLAPVLPRFLATHLPRIRHLALWGCQLTLPCVFQYDYPPTLALERLDLVLIPFSRCETYDLLGTHQASHQQQSAYRSLRAPNLRELHLDRVRLDTSAILRSTTLRTFSMQKAPSRVGLGGFQCLTDLSNLPKLEHLQYTLALRGDTTAVYWSAPQVGCKPVRKNEIRREKVDLSRLRSLDLWCHRTTTKARLQFFQQLHLPMLQELTLRRYDSFLSNSGTQDLVGIVQLLPSVRRLGLEISWEGLMAFVEQLKKAHRAPLLPRLHSFAIDELGGWDRPPVLGLPPTLFSTLEELVLARRVAQMVAPIEELSLPILQPKGWKKKIRRIGCDVKTGKLTRPYESWWSNLNSLGEDD